MFPAKQFRCSAIPTNVRNNCDKYYHFDKVIDRGNNNSSSISQPTDSHKITLGDMCPVQCGKCLSQS